MNMPWWFWPGFAVAIWVGTVLAILLMKMTNQM